MHFELEPLVCTLLISLSRSSDLMNRTGKWINMRQPASSQPIVTIVDFESTTDFKDFEALHSIVLDIDNQLLCSDVQTEAGQMSDELQRSFEAFQLNVNKLTLNIKWKKMHAFAVNDYA